MNIEDEIRRIAREEIARLFPQHRNALLDAPIVPRRMGCTCPPTGTSAACPDPTCPWKPQ